MGDRRRKSDDSLNPHEPASKKPSVTTSNQSQSSTQSDLTAATPSYLRRPLCAGRFSGSHFSPFALLTAGAGAPGTTFSRAAFARKVVQMHKNDQSHQPGKTDTPERVDLHGPVIEQKIGIIGAGMAGLYAALILDSLGFTHYEILEANPKRVGGRVFTRYFGSVDGDPQSKWNYIDFGAMRFPSLKIMDRVIGPQAWSLTNYLNSVLKEQVSFKINLLEYHLSVDNNLNYYNSTRKTNAEVEEMPDPLHFGKSKGGRLADDYVKVPYSTWLETAFDDVKKDMYADFNAGFDALMQLDHFSARAYLRTLRDKKTEIKFPPELIDYLETLDSATGHYDEALSEAIMDSFDFDAPSENEQEAVQWKCVEGGTSRFANAMVRVLRSKPKLNKKVTKIAPSSSSPGDIDVFVATELQPRTYHHVINTLPPAVVRTLDTSECNFSYTKRTALRILHVDSSVKIGLLFKTRWWQDNEIMKGKPIKGGQSSTDLPIRTIVYPSYGINDPDAAGVLIASYTWAQDAARIGALVAEPSQLIQLAMSNIATVHGLPLDLLQEQYTGQYFVQDWDQYEYSQGAFALFGAGQFVSLFPGLLASEMNDRYHTAGEMSSVHHAWIVGALNSAWRCVYEILNANGDEKKINELKEKWGEVDEVDMGKVD